MRAIRGNQVPAAQRPIRDPFDLRQALSHQRRRQAHERRGDAEVLKNQERDRDRVVERGWQCGSHRRTPPSRNGVHVHTYQPMPHRPATRTAAPTVARVRAGLAALDVALPRASVHRSTRGGQQGERRRASTPCAPRDRDERGRGRGSKTDSCRPMRRRRRRIGEATSPVQRRDAHGAIAAIAKSTAAITNQSLIYMSRRCQSSSAHVSRLYPEPLRQVADVRHRGIVSAARIDAARSRSDDSRRSAIAVPAQGAWSDGLSRSAIAGCR